MRKNPKRLLLVLAGILMIAPIAAQASRTDTDPQTMQLVNQVRHELVTLPFYSIFDSISVSAEGSTVTLTGQVTEPVLKSNAEKTVKQIAGVDKVVNQIEVLPLSRNDDRIRLSLYRAVYGNDSLHIYGVGGNRPIQTIVKNGHVTLEGYVLNEMDKTIVYMAASRVPGVFSVTNHLQLEKDKP